MGNSMTKNSWTNREPKSVVDAAREILSGERPVEDLKETQPTQEEKSQELEESKDLSKLKVGDTVKIDSGLGGTFTLKLKKKLSSGDFEGVVDMKSSDFHGKIMKVTKDNIRESSDPFRVIDPKTLKKGDRVDRLVAMLKRSGSPLPKKVRFTDAEVISTGSGRPEFRVTDDKGKKVIIRPNQVGQVLMKNEEYSEPKKKKDESSGIDASDLEDDSPEERQKKQHANRTVDSFESHCEDDEEEKE